MKSTVLSLPLKLVFPVVSNAKRKFNSTVRVSKTLTCLTSSGSFPSTKTSTKAFQALSASFHGSEMSHLPVEI